MPTVATTPHGTPPRAGVAVAAGVGSVAVGVGSADADVGSAEAGVGSVGVATGVGVSGGGLPAPALAVVPDVAARWGLFAAGALVRGAVAGAVVLGAATVVVGAVAGGLSTGGDPGGELPLPKAQPSALPFFGFVEAYPRWLYTHGPQEPSARFSACQYDQYRSVVGLQSSG